MLTDARGLPVTTSSDATLTAIDAFTTALLANTDDAVVALDAPKADPEAPLAHAMAGALMLFGETADAPAAACPHLDQALALSPRATERERMLIAAIDAWSRADIDKALLLHDEIATRWPRDIFNIKLAQHHCFNRGDATRLRDFAVRVLGDHPDCPYLLGMYAFGKEQCGELREAEEAGRKASDMGVNNPWAHHAVAHVLLTEERHKEGIDFLEGRAADWETCSTFMHSHNWWHLALPILALGDHARVLEIYDTRVWARDVDQVQPQVNAAGLLLRLAIRGVDVGNRWQAPAEKARSHMHDHVNGFLDLNFITTLANAGEDDAATEMLESIRSHAARRKAAGDTVWPEVIVPAAEALVAHARGDHRKAARLFDRAAPQLHLSGGSHAQRAMFAEAHADAIRRAETAAA